MWYIYIYFLISAIDICKFVHRDLPSQLNFWKPLQLSTRSWILQAPKGEHSLLCKRNSWMLFLETVCHTCWCYYWKLISCIAGLMADIKCAPLHRWTWWSEWVCKAKAVWKWRHGNCDGWRCWPRVDHRDASLSLSKEHMLPCFAYMSTKQFPTLTCESHPFWMMCSWADLPSSVATMLAHVFSTATKVTKFGQRAKFWPCTFMVLCQTNEG
jgi:hypothetical protein